MTENYPNLQRVLIDCELANVTLAIENDKLVAYPAERITDDLVDRIREHKGAIKASLERSASSPDCRFCSGVTIPIRTFDGDENFECFLCGKCSGCRKAVQ